MMQHIVCHHFTGTEALRNCHARQGHRPESPVLMSLPALFTKGGNVYAYVFKFFYAHVH